MSAAAQIDYDALAQQARTAKPVPKIVPKSAAAKPALVDYDALANQARQAKPVNPPADFTSNPKGEGVYEMLPPGGRNLSNTITGLPRIPYSSVERARNQGYRFADQKTLEQYGRDFANDPTKKEAIQTWQGEHPILGFIPKVFEGIGGSLVEGLAGADRLFSKIDPVRRIAGEGPIESLQLDAAKGANNPEAGVPEFIGAAGEQIAELLVGEGEARAALKGVDLAGSLASKAPQTAARLKELITVLDKYPKAKALLGLGMKMATEGTKAAAEQGTQELVRSGGDTEAAGQVAKGAGIMGASIPIVGSVVSKGGKLLAASLQQRFDIDPFSVGKRLKKLEEDWTVVHDDNLKKIREAQEAEKAANATKVPGASADYSHSTGAGSVNVEKSSRLIQEDLVAQQKHLAARQQVLSDAREQVRQVVWQRLQNMKSAARAYFGRVYGEIEEAGGGKGVDLETLVDDAEEARQHVKGSEDSLKVFNDLEHRYNHPDVDLSKPPNKDFSKEEWTTFSKKDREHAWKDALAEERAGSTVSLENLEGYHSELGKFANSKGPLGDLKAAAKAMQQSIDQRIQETYGEDVYKQVLKVRAQYREFAQAYLESESPLAKATDPKLQDAYNATDHFLSNEGRQPAVKTNIKNKVIGDAKDAPTQYFDKDIHETYERDPETRKMLGSGETTPAWRYRRQTHQMIEHLRSLDEGLQKTTTAAGKAQEAVATGAENLAKARTTVRNLTPVKKTTLPTMTPEELQQFKVETLANLAHNLGKFGTWVTIGGLVGGTSLLIGSAFSNDPKWKQGLQEGAGAIAVGSIAPHMLTNLLNRPGVVDSLTRLSRNDLQKLMKLPPSQRGPTEQLIKMLADEAVREGKLKPAQIPWLRVLAGTAARKRVEAGRQEGQDVTAGMDELEKLNNDLNQPTSQPIAPRVQP